LVDGWLGTEPWFTMVGAFVGAGAGFYYMYHHLVIRQRDADAGTEGDAHGRTRRP
jgi:hypothetical protein